MAKAKLPPGPLQVFSANGTTAILDANGNEVVGWSGFDDSNRTKAEHELLARELVRRFNAAGVSGRCPHCDDTGDVHRADGEWLGTCKCPAGLRVRLADGKRLCPRCKQPAVNLFRIQLPGDELDTTHCGCLYAPGMPPSSGGRP